MTAVGAIDIGSNTVRLLIRRDGRDLVRRVEVVGLGRGVDRTGALAPETMERALAVLGEFGRSLAEHRVGAVRAVATSASRDAANAGDFLDRVAAVLGTRPEIIPGTEEAALSFAGATAGIPGTGPVLVIDPGGGSTEFVFGDREPVWATSIDIGSVRLTDRLLPDRPARPGQLDIARNHVRGLFGAVDLPGVPERAIGVAGTFTSLAAIALGLEVYDPGRVHGSVLTLDALDDLVTRLAGLTVEETAAIPSLDPQRAPVLLAGAVVAAAAAECSGADRVVVSETDMLDAIAASLEG